jgi:hypothetical protein
MAEVGSYPSINCKDRSTCQVDFQDWEEASGSHVSFLN